jgi:hypothetical protein
MRRDALALASLRLAPTDPQHSSTRLCYAEELLARGKAEAAAANFLQAGRPLEAARALAARGSSAALAAASQLAAHMLLVQQEQQKQCAEAAGSAGGHSGGAAGSGPAAHPATDWGLLAQQYVAAAVASACSAADLDAAGAALQQLPEASASQAQLLLELQVKRIALQQSQPQQEEQQEHLPPPPPPLPVPCAQPAHHTGQSQAGSKQYSRRTLQQLQHQPAAEQMRSALLQAAPELLLQQPLAEQGSHGRARRQPQHRHAGTGQGGRGQQRQHHQHQPPPAPAAPPAPPPPPPAGGGSRCYSPEQLQQLRASGLQPSAGMAAALGELLETHSSSQHTGTSAAAPKSTPPLLPPPAAATAPASGRQYGARELQHLQGASAQVPAGMAAALQQWDGELLLPSSQLDPGKQQQPPVQAAEAGSAAVQQLYCWGAGTNGQLGDGRLQDALQPEAVALPAGTAAVQALASGSNHVACCTTQGQQ